MASIFLLTLLILGAECDINFKITGYDAGLYVDGVINPLLIPASIKKANFEQQSPEPVKYWIRWVDHWDIPYQNGEEKVYYIDYNQYKSIDEDLWTLHSSKDKRSFRVVFYEMAIPKNDGQHFHFEGMVAKRIDMKSVDQNSFFKFVVYDGKFMYNTMDLDELDDTKFEAAIQVQTANTEAWCHYVHRLNAILTAQNQGELYKEVSWTPSGAVAIWYHPYHARTGTTNSWILFEFHANTKTISTPFFTDLMENIQYNKQAFSPDIIAKNGLSIHEGAAFLYFTFNPHNHDELKYTLKVVADKQQYESTIYWYHQVTGQCVFHATKSILQSDGASLTEMDFDNLHEKVIQILKANKSKCPHCQTSSSNQQFIESIHQTNQVSKSRGLPCGQFASCVAEQQILIENKDYYLRGLLEMSQQHLSELLKDEHFIAIWMGTKQHTFVYKAIPAFGSDENNKQRVWINLDSEGGINRKKKIFYTVGPQFIGKDDELVTKYNSLFHENNGSPINTFIAVFKGEPQKTQNFFDHKKFCSNKQKNARIDYMNELEYNEDEKQQELNYNAYNDYMNELEYINDEKREQLNDNSYIYIMSLALWLISSLLICVTCFIFGLIFGKIVTVLVNRINTKYDTLSIHQENKVNGV